MKVKKNDNLLIFLQDGPWIKAYILDIHALCLLERYRISQSVSIAKQKTTSETNLRLFESLLLTVSSFPEGLVPLQKVRTASTGSCNLTASQPDFSSVLKRNFLRFPPRISTQHVLAGVRVPPSA